VRTLRLGCRRHSLDTLRAHDLVDRIAAWEGG